MLSSRFAPAGVLFLVTGAVLVPIGAASAAAPTNDTYGGRTVISGVPYAATLDTSEATTDASDTELNDQCGAPATDASVWLEYTAVEDGALLVGLSADYSAGAMVATGGPGAWVVEACAPEAVAFSATAGTTYTIVVFDDQFDGGGNGGSVDVTLDVAPPTPEIDLTVNPTARFQSDGSLVLSGTVTCTAGAFASIEGQVTQQVGRLKINGWGYTDIDCGDGTAQPWTMSVVGDNGVFKGGKAATANFAYACGAFDCGTDYEEATVRVSGGKR